MQILGLGNDQACSLPSEMMAKLSDVDEKFKVWNEDEMNQAELNYYLEVQGRVTKKILKVTQ